MLIVPILHKSKIYHFEIKLKNVYENDEAKVFEKRYESDVIVNGRSYNQSDYYIPSAPLTNVLDFIRDHSFSHIHSFVLTSRRNEQGKMKTFRIASPLPRVTEGLDMLYSSALLNMKKEIPGKCKDRNVSLKKLGVTSHITDEKLKILERASDSSIEIVDENILQIRDEFSQTLTFLEQFECTMLDEATVDEKSIFGLMIPLGGLNTSGAKEIREYYRLAKENRDEYGKLQYLSRMMTGEPLYWIKEEKDFTKVKNRDGRYE